MRKYTALVLAIVFVISSSGIGFAVDTNTLTVSATVVGTCKFNSATSTLGFGALDPASGAPATASSTTTFWCTNGTAYTLGDDDGLYESGPGANRMRHATDPTQFIPYTMGMTPTSGTGAGAGSPTTLTITGDINFVDYENALAGDYADTVVITVTP